MVSGRLPRPTALKVLAGEKHKDRINTNEPKAPPGEPPMPAGLDEAGATMWRALVAALDSLGILSTADAIALQMFCETYSGYREAHDKSKEFGQVLIQNGIPKRNPYMTEVHMHRAELLKQQAEFGLTPAQRSRIVAPGADKPLDILDELMN